MKTLSLLSVGQLERAVVIKRQIENLQRELDLITGDGDGSRQGRFTRSAEVRARMAAAAKQRWAKRNGQESAAPAAKKRNMSAAGRAAISAAAKARWAKIKAETGTN